MTDLSDTIQETTEHARESKINAKVAVWVALTATFMAICNVKDGNIVQAMSQAQAHSIDAWSYFQAKSTKEAILENSVEILKLQKSTGSEELIKKDEQQIARYEKEKEEIKKICQEFHLRQLTLMAFFKMMNSNLPIMGIILKVQLKWFIILMKTLVSQILFIIRMGLRFLEKKWMLRLKVSKEMKL